jgi:hypothetical protein
VPQPKKKPKWMFISPMVSRKRAFESGHESTCGRRFLQRHRAGAAIGGTLYSDGLTKQNGETPSYIEMVRHDARTIASALRISPFVRPRDHALGF